MHQFWHVIYAQKSATLTGHSALSLDRYRNCAKIFSDFLSSPTLRQVKKATNIYIWLISTRWRKAVYNILHLQIRHKVKSLLSFPRTTRWKNVTDIAPNLSRVEGILKFFLLFDTASVVVSVSIAATKCHSSMLSKTRQRSVVVFSLLRFCALWFTLLVRMLQHIKTIMFHGHARRSKAATSYSTKPRENVLWSGHSGARFT